MGKKYIWLSTHMYNSAQYILSQKQIYQIVFWFVWERGKSRQRILKVFVPLSTVIQGGTMGGWGPDAEAKTAESFGTTFNLRRRAIVCHGHLGSPTLTWDFSRCSDSLSQEAQGQLAHPHPRYFIFTRLISKKSRGILFCRYSCLTSMRWRRMSRGPVAITSQLVEEHQRA